tara:strand:+ start:1955 stop:2653 length:699 start_codon:yes stop_codon:yes gene_type:complete
MAQAGLHAAIGLQAKHFIPYEKRIFPSLIFGTMLPDLDIIVVAFASIFYTIDQAEFFFHRTFSHSFFSLIIIYLLFSILAEINKKPRLQIIGKGIALGMLIHCIIDAFLWFHHIHLLWPLPIDPINLWKLWELPPIVHKLLLALEFFFFRWYAWFLTTQHLKYPNPNSWIVKYLNQWKNIESIMFLFIIILIIWNLPFFKILFGICYIPSLIIALIATYISRDSLECRADTL